MDNLNKAITLLRTKCDVIPDRYTMYNGAYLFRMKDGDKYMSPFYLVDLRLKEAGPFSPAFDLNGFFKAAENMIEI